MNAMTFPDTISATMAAQTERLTPGDPLDADAPFDEVVVTTSRALCRLALIASETGSRFQREGEPHDPMAWLLAPRRMFGGSTALEACLKREHFMRALLLHGLSLGLDADPEDIDDLLNDNPNDCDTGPLSLDQGTAHPVSPVRLYTASVLRSASGSMLQAFHASVASSAEECRARIEARLGPAAAKSAEIRVGFDPAAPMVLALVPAPLVKVLRDAERRSAEPGYADFAVTIEHRVEA